MIARAIAVAGLATAALLAPATASAQSPFKIGLAVGPSFPTGDVSDSQEWGYNFSASIGIKPMLSPVGFRIEGMWNQFTGKDVATPLGDVNFDDLRILAGTANVELGLGGVAVKPYAIGGLGMYNMSIANDGTDESSTEFGFNLGGGIRFDLAGFSTFAEARFHNVSVEGGNVRFIPLTFGVSF